MRTVAWRRADGTVLSQVLVRKVNCAALAPKTICDVSLAQKDACRYGVPVTAALTGVVDTRRTTRISELASRFDRHGAMVPGAKPCTPSGIVTGDPEKP